MSTARTAIVTGAGGGIGQAFCKALVRSGIQVLAVDLLRGRLAALDAEVKAGGLQNLLQTLAIDQCAASANERIIDLALSRFGTVDILVNNIGIGQGSLRADNWLNPVKFWEVTESQWQRYFAINSTSGFLLSRLAAPLMVERGWGRIINVTTSLGSMLRRGYTPYGPSKAALEALTSIMAHDLAGTGVTANVLVPGGVTNTPMIPDESRFDRSELLQPEVMVAPLLHLVSDAAAEITGQRFLAIDWDASLQADQAAAKAGAPVAWRGIATMPVFPPSR